MSLSTESGHSEIGRAIDEWSICEGWLDYMFSNLIHVEMDIGHAIMATFTAGPKRELLERIVGLTVMPEGLRNKLKFCCKEFGRLTAQRNKIVHGEWVLLADGTQYRVGNTKHLRYFDRYMESGEDPQSAIFTVEMIIKFREDCEKLKWKFAELAEDETFRKLFPYV
jgi:hypothetical protein